MAFKTRGLAFTCLLGLITALDACDPPTLQFSAPADPTNPISTNTVPPPIIISPSNPLFYSQSSTFTISGTCLSGNTVRLLGAATATSPCTLGTFTLIVTKGTDGLYAFSLQQVDPQNQTSASVGLQWDRKTSVGTPTIVSPGATYHSAAPSVVISGACENGATVNLTGSASQSSACAGGEYSFSVNKGSDGVYNFNVAQTDLAANSSSVATLTWTKAVVTITPTAPALLAGASQAFAAGGGNGTFTFLISANASGASFGTSSSVSPVTYTAGSTDTVSDTVKVTDGQGYSATATVGVIAPPDHLAVVAGNAGTASVGTAFSPKIKVQLLNHHGTPYVATRVPLILSQLQGFDSTVTASPINTDVNGYAEFNAQAGFGLLTNIFQVATANATPLPDVAATGHAKLQFSESVTSAGNGSFGAVTTYATGSHPMAVATADLNGDGKLDLITGNEWGPSISVLLGNGDGTFQAKNDVPMANSMMSIATGDFNHDGKIDIVTANNNTGTVSILMGKGDGTFQSPVFYAVGGSGQGPNNIVVGDFNKDGNLDIAVANSAANTVSVLLGNGDGTFAAKVDYATASYPVGMVAGDFRSNGKIDLAVACADDNVISVLLGNDDGTFQTKVNYATASSGPQELAVGDFNNDHKLDLIVANSGSSSLQLLTGNGDGTFTGHAVFDSGAGTYPFGIATGDFNGDGKLDFAVLKNNTSPGYFSVFLGNGDATFQTRVDYPAGVSAFFLTAGDFNGDHKIDLAVGNWNDNTVGVRLGQ